MTDLSGNVLAVLHRQTDTLLPGLVVTVLASSAHLLTDSPALLLVTGQEAIE